MEWTSLMAAAALVAESEDNLNPFDQGEVVNGKVPTYLINCTQTMIILY